MIDPLDTAASYVDSCRLDAKTICGSILKAKAGKSSALYVTAPAAAARKAQGRARDYLARIENPELAHLYVEVAVGHRGLGACGAAERAAQRAVQALRRMHAWLKPNNYVEMTSRRVPEWHSKRRRAQELITSCQGR